MEQYIISFATIVLVYVSIINLNSYKFKAKEIILMVGLAQVSSSILLNLGKFMDMIPIIIISIIFLYKKSKNLVSSISIPIVSLFIAILCEYFIAYICIFLFKIGTNDIRGNSKLYWQLIIFDLILIFIISKFLENLINKKIVTTQAFPKRNVYANMKIWS